MKLFNWKIEFTYNYTVTLYNVHFVHSTMYIFPCTYNYISIKALIQFEMYNTCMHFFF